MIQLTFGKRYIKEPERSWLSRYGFQLFVGAFILLSSFIYGLSVGVKNQKQRALATLDRSTDLSGFSFPTEVPRDILLMPLGQDVSINNKLAKVTSFVSDRPALEILSEQEGLWKQLGIKVIGTHGSRRGYVIGARQDTGERFYISAWTVPPPLRSTASQGRSVQGYLSYLDPREKISSDSENENGLIAGVPLRDGGKGGAVFSSRDPGGRSYSTVYTNPGSLFENLDFYKEELRAKGWQLVLGDFSRADLEAANLVFQNGQEEIVLLFSPGQHNSNQTVVAVTRGPLLLSQGKKPW